MGITLTSKSIAATYDGLLKLTDNDPLSGAFKKVTDGFGNETGISLNNTGAVEISGTLTTADISATNIVVSGYLRGPATFVIDPAAYGNNTGLVQILGDLRVEGTTTTINSTTLDVADKNITIAKDAATSGDADGAGITIAGANATLTYLSATDDFTFNKDVRATEFIGPLTGNVSGNVTGNLTGNVTGTVSTLSNHDTDDLDEGLTNLYFTTARARDAFSAGTGVSISSGVISIGQSVGTTDDVTFGTVTASLSGNATTASALEASVNIALDGSVTGNADFDGSGNITITTTTNHNHDDRYYTETESDNRFVNVSGDTMTGNLNWGVTDRGLTWAMNTDGAYIKFFNTGDGDTNSRLEYATSDNGNEYHRFMISGTERMKITETGITATGYNKTNWDDAYSWGDHDGLYLPITGGELTGTNNNLVINEIAENTWAIQDTFQDNGIIINSGSGGLEFQYNGVTELTIDGSGVSFNGTINLDAADLNIGAADIIFDTAAGGATRGVIWNVSGSGYLSKIISGGADQGKVTVYTNIGTTTVGNTFEIYGANGLGLSLSNSGVLIAGGGTSTQWNTAYNYSQVGHLPLTGGTLSGPLTSGRLTLTNNVSAGGFTSFNDYQILLYQSSTGFTQSYGIGIESETMMFNSDDRYRFYVDNVVKATIESTGSLILTGGITAAGVVAAESGLLARKTSKSAYGIQIKGGYYGSPRLQLYDLAVDENAFIGLGTDMSGSPFEFSNYFPRYSGFGKWSVGSWAGDFGTGQYVSGYNEKMYITESAAVVTVPFTSSTGGVAITASSSQNTGLIVDGGTNSGIIADFRYGATKAVINTSGGGYFLGDIGVGYTAPQQKLMVAGTSSNAGNTFAVYNTSPSSSNKNTVNIGDERIGTWGLLLGKSGTSTPDAGYHYPDGAHIVNVQNGPLRFGTNNDYKMQISASGNVSIGNKNDTYKLDVSGAARFTSEVGFESYIDLTGPLFLRSNVNYLNGAGNGWNTFLTRNGERFDGYFANTYNSGVLQVTGETTLLGSVGIGTATTAYGFLTISSGNKNGIRIDTNNGYSAINIGGTGSFSMDAPGVGGGRFIVTDSGSIGIGNAVPATKLDVVADTAQLRLHRADGGGQDWRFYSWGAGLNIYPQQASAVYFGRDGAATDVELYNGNLVVSGTVAIGTGSASEKLDVRGNLRIGTGAVGNEHMQVHYANGSSGYGAIRFYQSGSNHSTIHSFSSSWQSSSIYSASTGAINLDATNGVTFGPWNNVDVVFPYGGNAYFKNSIGVGVTSPSYKLDVSGDARATGNLISDFRLMLPNMTIGYWDGLYNRIESGSSRPLFITAYSQPIYMGRNGSIGDFTLNTSGQIGLGTTNPSKPLQVQKRSIAEPAIMIGGAYYGGPRLQVYGLDADPNGWMGLGTDMGGNPYEHSVYFPDTGTYGTLSFGTYNGTTYSLKMCIKRTGVVGVGTNGPEAKFQVNHNGQNGSGGLSDYAIVAVADNTGNQATIGSYHTGNGYANLNLASQEGSNKRFWHISKRLAADSHRLEYYYYTSEASFASRFAFMTNGDFHADGDIIAYSSTISDKRLKDDVKTIDNALDKVKAMRGVEYVWNAGSRKGQKDLGLIAQEVEDVLPEIVREKETIYHGEEGKYKTVDYEKIVGVLIEAVKEQQKQIDELKAIINGSTK